MIDIAVIHGIKRKFNRLGSELDDRGRRCWAVNEALELGYGGIKAVAQATGLGERTIRRGCEEMHQVRPTTGHDKRRVRHTGGGRKSLPVINPDLVTALEALVDPNTRGAPMPPLRWT
jgi:hypothetical protein